MRAVVLALLLLASCAVRRPVNTDYLKAPSFRAFQIKDEKWLVLAIPGQGIADAKKALSCGVCIVNPVAVQMYVIEIVQ